MTLRDRFKNTGGVRTDLTGVYADSTGRMEAREEYRIPSFRARRVSADEVSAGRWATQKLCDAWSEPFLADLPTPIAHRSRSLGVGPPRAWPIA